MRNTTVEVIERKIQSLNQGIRMKTNVGGWYRPGEDIVADIKTSQISSLLEEQGWNCTMEMIARQIQRLYITRW